MSIRINLNMKRTLTKDVYGSFTSNHTEDEVREWINSGGMECRTDELGFTSTDEEEWKPNSLLTESYLKGEDENDFKFDDAIQEWRNKINNPKIVS